MKRNLPLVVILGVTATGKSKLAIELARKFNGEIVSADSMQVYKGLRIVTNKVTEDEQKQAKHHMIDFLNPLSRYSVIDFRNSALKIIDNLIEKDKLPILVGGTHYYIESILWKSFTHGEHPKRTYDEIDDDKDQLNTLLDLESHLVETHDIESFHSEEDFDSVEKFFSKPIRSLAFKNVEPEKLWTILEKVDPKTAHIFHPNDKRRVITSLQLIQRTNKTYSNYMYELNKSNETEKQSLGGSLRYNKVCVIWLNADKQMLDVILDKRVDEMISRGLISELEEFHDKYNKVRVSSSEDTKYDYGIFQTIGFKEFHNYLIMDDESKSSPEGKKILDKCISELKNSTQRYAKTQMRWIRRRFLRAGTRDLPPMFKLDVRFEEEEWIKNVLEPAINIIELISRDQPYDDFLSSLLVKPSEQEIGQFEPGKLYCETCERLIIGKINIERHLNSRNHERKIKSIERKKAKRETIVNQKNSDNLIDEKD